MEIEEKSIIKCVLKAIKSSGINLKEEKAVEIENMSLQLIEKMKQENEELERKTLTKYFCSSVGFEVITPVNTSSISNIAIKNLIDKILKVICVFLFELKDDKLILCEDNIFHNGYGSGEGEWKISELNNMD